ncbi:uncharacterized protein LACBIDRAFT_327829 [Laccaria bicolor S238N-H82]|uniref:Predicted protein n=1 Tax=Laccaria bicolor (strain S238N-H82 / ATCC MYA-4686) TaxID=486041 RepID=B0DCY9_LACBS|nr:uncharacterized protein LACBIDRAFT_327829 [Laccaria bicolor S238N-H82]EDR07382.1 predicted protein [Laccaria bicolor S238N-H82]|eukprot:XP_001881774.1 predicted protein [Laccaria bicolor S238N-H82]
MMSRDKNLYPGKFEAGQQSHLLAHRLPGHACLSHATQFVSIESFLDVYPPFYFNILMSGDHYMTAITFYFYNISPCYSNSFFRVPAITLTLPNFLDISGHRYVAARSAACQFLYLRHVTLRLKLDFSSSGDHPSGLPAIVLTLPNFLDTRSYTLLHYAVQIQFFNIRRSPSFLVLFVFDYEACYTAILLLLANNLLALKHKITRLMCRLVLKQLHANTGIPNKEISVFKRVAISFAT